MQEWRHTTHLNIKNTSSNKSTSNLCGKKNRQQKEKHPTSYWQSDPKQRQLTGSLVFDEEQLEALLESVLIHIELYLHPMRWMERWAETEREREGDKDSARAKKGARRRRCRWLKGWNTSFMKSSLDIKDRKQVVGWETKAQRIKGGGRKSAQLSKLEIERVIMIIWTLKSMEIRPRVWPY